MHTELSFAFTGLEAFLLLAVPAVLALLLRQLSRSAPPAVILPGRPFGIGGLLFWLLYGLSLEAVVRLFAFGRASGEVARVISMNADFWLPAMETLIPLAVASAALLTAILLLTFGRSRASLWTAVLCIWVAGPGYDALNAVILGIPFDPDRGFAGVSFFTIVATLYLLFSVRAGGTYGTGAARRLEALASAEKNRYRIED